MFDQRETWNQSLLGLDIVGDELTLEKLVKEILGPSFGTHRRVMAMNL